MFFSCLLVAATLAAANANLVPCDPCIDRSSVRIGCVHHGIPSQDVFWQLMDSAIAQGAKDMGIDLLYDPITDLTLDERDEASIEEYMAGRIQELCLVNKVNGIFVSLPNPSLIDALHVCRDANIPAIVFNAGNRIAEQNGYLFIGQDERRAGFEAGAGLAKVDGTSTFCCINHAPGVGVLRDRCLGFGSGLEANGVAVGYTDVHVNPNNCSFFTDAIVTNCNAPRGNWSRVGLYLAGQANHQCGVEFLRKHPATYIDASDVSEALYAGMMEGYNILFGIDQQTYLQGYLPSSFLTLASTNNQMVQDESIETGPKLVTVPPSEHYQQCKANGYAVCDDGGPCVTSSSSFLSIRLRAVSTCIFCSIFALWL